MHLIKILNNQNRVQDRASHNCNTDPRNHRRHKDISRGLSKHNLVVDVYFLARASALCNSLHLDQNYNCLFEIQKQRVAETYLLMLHHKNSHMRMKPFQFENCAS